MYASERKKRFLHGENFRVEQARKMLPGLGNRQSSRDSLRTGVHDPAGAWGKDKRPVLLLLAEYPLGEQNSPRAGKWGGGRLTIVLVNVLRFFAIFYTVLFLQSVLQPHLFSHPIVRLTSKSKTKVTGLYRPQYIIPMSTSVHHPIQSFLLILLIMNLHNSRQLL